MGTGAVRVNNRERGAQRMSIVCTCGDVTAEARRCGGDLAVVVCGGTRHHVGAVSLAQYEPERDSATVSTLTAYTHRDDAVAAQFAKELSRKFKCTVSVTVGIHIDCADDEQIKGLCASCGECLEKLKEMLEVEK